MKVIIPCVDYGSYLYTTLPEWLRAVPTFPADFIIVTHPDDTETQRIAHSHGVTVLETDIWYANNHKFDKAAALDHAIIGRAQEGEIILCLDADVRPSKPTIIFPVVSTIGREVIYGCKKLNEDGEVEISPYMIEITRNGRGDSPESCSGHFQLFRYNYQRKFGSYPTAGEYDRKFAYSFPRAKTLNFVGVIHLGEPRINWEGRNNRVI